MRFLIRKHRAAPAVIIVALIDVLIVLVIFLLVTTTFRQQPSLKLALPTSTSALKAGANDNPPQIVYIEAQDLLRFGPNADVVTLDQLRSRLIMEAEKTRAAGKEPMLAVRADKAAHWERIVQVMDIAKAADIRILSAYTKDASKQ